MLNAWKDVLIQTKKTERGRKEKKTEREAKNTSQPRGWQSSWTQAGHLRAAEPSCIRAPKALLSGDTGKPLLLLTPPADPVLQQLGVSQGEPRSQHAPLNCCWLLKPKPCWERAVPCPQSFISQHLNPVLCLHEESHLSSIERGPVLTSLLSLSAWTRIPLKQGSIK